ncbi:MAG: Na-translocating system protein MpsC family protein [Tepidibacillus sp.]
MKGQLEADLNIALSRFHKEITGRGPKQIRTKITENIVVVKFIPYPEPIFKHLAKIETGREMLKEITKILFENTKDEIKNVLKDLVHTEVRDLFFDGNIENESEEIILVATCKENILEEM